MTEWTTTRRSALAGLAVTSVAMLLTEARATAGIPQADRVTPRSGPAASAQPGPVPQRPGPAEALADLLAGNRRFVHRRPRHGHDMAAAAAVSGGQQPYAVVLGCIDSRVPLEAIFDQDFGCICVVRSGGHVLDRAVLGSVEFAISALGVSLVMVLGHERCGAIEATVQALRDGRRPDGAMAYLVGEIAPAVQAAGLHHPKVLGRALRRHVTRTVERLEDVPLVAERTATGEVAVVGAVYDLDTGHVRVIPRSRPCGADQP
jgi:carbonic anhydrase